MAPLVMAIQITEEDITAELRLLLPHGTIPGELDLPEIISPPEDHLPIITVQEFPTEEDTLTVRALV